MQQLQIPPLAEGEIYVGAIGDKAGNLHHVILLPGTTKAKWKDAMAWAESIGGVLPTRVESALLLNQAKDQFEEDWYWTGDEFSSAPGWAWFQDFGFGSQDDYRKDYGIRARAVRRLPI